MVLAVEGRARERLLRFWSTWAAVASEGMNVGLADDLKQEVKDIFATRWISRDGQVVPEPGTVKLGNDAVKLEATVLYADLAGSTATTSTSGCSALITSPTTIGSPETWIVVLGSPSRSRIFRISP